MSAVKIEDLRFSYAGKRGGKRVEVLRGIELTVERGTLFGFLGPNGSGKTTLFKLLSTLLSGATGTAELMGVDIARNPFEARKKIGVVFQNPSLDPKLTVLENLQHQGHLYGLTGAELADRIEENLKKFTLTDLREKMTEHLSGGQKRRVELAKGMLHEPELLILDEPSTGLDPSMRGNLWDTLDELKKERGMTILVTTHLIKEAERCDMLAILDTGRLVTRGRPEELKQTIGGEVLMVNSPDPGALRDKYNEKYEDRAKVVNGAVRIELKDAHRRVPELVDTFPDLVAGLSYGRPTLEDVFTHHTGRSFEERGEDA